MPSPISLPLFVPTSSAVSATSLPEPQHCSQSVYGCCSDGVTAALGVEHAGCPSKSFFMSHFDPLLPMSLLCTLKIWRYYWAVSAYCTDVAEMKMFHLNPRNNYDNVVLYQQKNLFIWWSWCMIAHRWGEKCCIKLLARGYSIDGENADLEIRIYRDLVKGKLAKAHFIHLFIYGAGLIHHVSLVENLNTEYPA